jgi:hypothetical protein
VLPAMSSFAVSLPFRMDIELRHACPT